MSETDGHISLNPSLADAAALYRVTSAIIERTELVELLQIVADSVAVALPAERIAIITFDLEARKTLHFVKGGVGVNSVQTVPFEELLQGLSGWVLRENAPALSLSSAPDPRESPEVQQRRADTNCGDIIVVPLRYHGKTLGTMTAINRPQGAPFGQKQVDLMMAMATHSAVAITTAQDQLQLKLEIQERKNLEASLALARDQALESSRLKSEFMANMSHEIRTPMNAILGMLNLLQSTELTSQQRDYASKSEGAAKSLLGLLNDILDFSKAEAGKMTVEHQPFQMETLLRNLAVVLSANVGNKQVEVLFDVRDKLPDLVLGDEMRLQQVLINLGGNAVKFTPKGHVIVRLRLVATKAESVQIEFAVQDTGIGIAQEAQTRIFSGFSQAEASTTRLFGGTGWGLSISKHFVALMGGEIQVSSALGEGSTFSFTLEFPLAKDARLGTALAMHATPKPQHVLVIDDNPIAGELTVGMVESWGWSAELATSSADALSLIAARHAKHPGVFPFPLICVDWQMHGMDGWETTKRIRQFAKQHPLAQPAVIMLTDHGHDTLAQRPESEQDILNGFMVKPFTATMLFEAVLEAHAGQGGIRRITKGKSSQRQLAGMRILVVEDNLINQQVADELLSARGAIVSLAANGQLGVDAVAAAAPQFDVVLMDVQMPVLDGYGATHLIRNELGLTDLPIVAMTANAMASDRDACIAAGMNEHIGKPFDTSKLVSLLIRMTGLQPTSSRLEDKVVSPTEALNIPDVAGLELHTALARMSGMQSLYVRTARDFVQIMDTVIPELRQYLAAGDQQKAVMRLHTLKGNAGTLGATELAAKAAKLEKLCATGAGMQECEEVLGRFETLVRTTQNALHEAIALLVSQPAGGKAIGERRAKQPVSEATLGAVRRIAEMAKASDMEALQEFSQARELLAELPEEFVDALDLALQELDLEVAGTHCDALLSRLHQ